MLQAATFFLNDPLLFPDLIHAAKKNPKDGLLDYNTLWDFLTQHPVTFNAVL
jgi:catalase